MSGWKNPHAKDDPRALLLEYQLAYWSDMARFKIGLWARQTGKDFTTSGEAVADCMTRKTQWMVAAPSERQSLETLDKAKEWAEAFQLKIDDYQERREGGSEALLKSAEITWANGSKMRAVPGRPDTVRGMSANLILTEFDFFEDPAATWRAIFPSVTNPLRGGQKRVRIITTPNGIGGAAHRIWTKEGGKIRWSKHKVTIHDAVAMGLPMDVEELREAFDDPEGWAQEYECEFLDTSSVLLPYDVIAAVENPLATASVGPEYWLATGGTPVDLGIDFGRKRDLTVCWAAENLGGFRMTREVLEIERTPTHRQLEILRPRVKKARRVCFDYTGPGIGLGDLLVKEFGEYAPSRHLFGKVELVTFTNDVKCEIFPRLRAEADRRMLGIPAGRAIREDLHSMCRVVTPAGNVTYRAPHTDDGHADRCTALALCVRAGDAQGFVGRIVASARALGRAAARRERGCAGV
jgi:phage FluMu gp28-like protein